MKPLSDEEFEERKKWFNEVRGNIAIIPSIHSLIIELITTIDKLINENINLKLENQKLQKTKATAQLEAAMRALR